MIQKFSCKNFRNIEADNLLCEVYSAPKAVIMRESGVQTITYT